MSFDLSIFNPGARPLMGLDVSSSAVKLVELSRTAKGEHRIERYASENLPRDAVVDGNIAKLDEVADAVRRAWRRMGTSTRNVCVRWLSTLNPTLRRPHLNWWSGNFRTAGAMPISCWSTSART